MYVWECWRVKFILLESTICLLQLRFMKHRSITYATFLWIWFFLSFNFCHFFFNFLFVNYQWITKMFWLLVFKSLEHSHNVTVENHFHSRDLDHKELTDRLSYYMLPLYRYPMSKASASHLKTIHLDEYETRFSWL